MVEEEEEQKALLQHMGKGIKLLMLHHQTNGQKRLRQ
jgi:hypothetical protein